MTNDIEFLRATFGKELSLFLAGSLYRDCVSVILESHRNSYVDTLVHLDCYEHDRTNVLRGSIAAIEDLQQTLSDIAQPEPEEQLI